MFTQVVKNQPCTGGGVLLVPQHEKAPSIYRFYKTHPARNRVHAAAFVLTYHFDMDKKQVASILNVSLKTAYTYVDTAGVMHRNNKAFRAECNALIDYIIGNRRYIPYDYNKRTERGEIRSFTPYSPKRKKSN